MATNAEQIESMLDEQEITYFAGEGDRWMIPGESVFVCIGLFEDGEYVRFSGSVIADLDELSSDECRAALRHFMELNDQIKLGRFCGFPKVNFEIGLPLEDAEITSDQFHRCLSVTMASTASTENAPPVSSTEGSSEPFLLPHTSRLPPECD